MENINWIYYVASSPDLVAVQFFTKELALNHYLTYGHKEVRYTQIRPCSRYLICHLRLGLANQLYGFLNSIVLGHYSGRQVKVRYFTLQFDKEERCPASVIFDLPHLNNLLQKLGFNTTVSDYNITPTNLVTLEGKNYIPLLLSGNKPLQSFTFLKDIIQHPTSDVDVEFPFSYPLYECYPDSIDKERIAKLLSEFRFAPIFYTIRDYCLTELGLTNFTAVHLRLEDDILSYHHPLEMDHIKQKYITRMKDSGTSKFFLATYLGKSVQQNNYFLDTLDREFPKSCEYWTVNRSWRRLFPTMMKGREIDAIVDYLVCCSATTFIGYKSSTFSETIYEVFRASEKRAEYLNN